MRIRLFRLTTDRCPHCTGHELLLIQNSPFCARCCRPYPSPIRDHRTLDFVEPLQLELPL